MSRLLPSNPSLEQLKNQARDLLKAHKNGASETFTRIRENLPRWAKIPEKKLSSAKFSLRDAQSVIAREYGFSSWQKLRCSVEEMVDGNVRERIFRLVEEQPDEVARGIRAMQGTPQELGTLMVALGEEATGELMKHLSDSEIENTTGAIAGLENVGEEAQVEALESFEKNLKDGFSDSQEAADTGYGDFVMGALERAIGPERAKAIVEKQGIPVGRGKPKSKPKPKLSAEYLAAKKEFEEKLRGIPSLQMDLDELREVLVQMTEIARVEEILALEEIVGSFAKVEDFLKYGLTLAIDGTRPDLLTDLLETQMQTLVHRYETRCRMIVAGVKALQTGDNPRLVDHKLSAMYK